LKNFFIFLIIAVSDSQIKSDSMSSSSANFANFTPISPIRDLKGDATIHMLSTPAFFPTPSGITPAKLFPTPSVESISPSSLRFSTPNYKNHFSSFLEPTPSAPINIVNELRWMTPSVEELNSTSSSYSSSDSDSAHSNSATGSLSESSSSESLQFKWSETP
jgi:hypothetical protein